MYVKRAAQSPASAQFTGAITLVALSVRVRGGGPTPPTREMGASVTSSYLLELQDVIQISFVSGTSMPTFAKMPPLWK